MSRLFSLLYLAFLNLAVVLHAADPVQTRVVLAGESTVTDIVDEVRRVSLEAETLKGGTDAELLAWAIAHGRKPTDTISHK